MGWGLASAEMWNPPVSTGQEVSALCPPPETAVPHRLIERLFCGSLEALSTPGNAFEGRQVQSKTIRTEDLAELNALSDLT
jgi:hypothetical protein